MCSHPLSGHAADNSTQHVVSAHPEQGWTLLCDGAIVFDDTGTLLPDGRIIAPRRVYNGQLAVAA